ncbi:helix-turn-helix domain-containing protein [Corynebacterium sp. c8Ua_181]|uniref:Glycerol operon regulatory protein n=1 Tax=Corynebacterium curieae TaxID=2913500 RepID=A0A9X3MBU8_9CORY|nr:IclR family transcriptional regulator C-terminal domain-containing protein [Corynebacterium curieae]MCZ9306448.1 helix-turn-helix domain-containing protein [Corynebacterium curieae]MDV2423983.1 IclR family transcriptional regulator C-terminal domain-containing protein [Corynebacterium curieae]
MTDTPTVQSLARGLAVLHSFNGDRPRQSLTQVAEVTGLARATARRFLHTLVAEGYARTDGAEFWLTPRVLELGYSYLSSLGLPEIAQPHLRELSTKLDESCSVSVLDRDTVVYVARTAAHRIMATNITIGTRFPAHATSMGQVLLANLPPAQLDEFLAHTELEQVTSHTLTTPDELRARLAEVRNRGWVIVDQELEVGLRSIAAPIRDGNGRTVAAINVSTQTSVYSTEDITTRLLPQLLETCEAISHDLATTNLA